MSIDRMTVIQMRAIITAMKEREDEQGIEKDEGEGERARGERERSKNIAGRVDSRRSRLVWSYHNRRAEQREWF